MKTVHYKGFDFEYELDYQPAEPQTLGQKKINILKNILEVSIKRIYSLNQKIIIITKSEKFIYYDKARNY